MTLLSIQRKQLVRVLSMLLVGSLLSCAARASDDKAPEQAHLDPSLTALMPGMWTMTRVVQATALPMPPRPRTANICVDPAKGGSVLTLTSYKIDGLFDVNCQIKDTSKTVEGDVTHVTLALKCTPALASSGKIELTLTGNKKVSATSSYFKDSDQPWMVYHEESTWQGSCNN